MIANPRFQRWAADFPLTRLIARRRARALFDLCAGFVYSQILLACVRLRSVRRTRQGPAHGRRSRAAIGLPPAGARRLLRAAASLRLVRELARRSFALDDLGAALLGNPAIAALSSTMRCSTATSPIPWRCCAANVSTQLARFWPYAIDSPQRPGASVGAPNEAFGAYSALMSATQPLVAEDILDAYPVERHACLLDVGGGEGAFLASAAAARAALEAAPFRSAASRRRARPRLAALGLTVALKSPAAIFWSDLLPQGADLISLVRVLHDHDDESALRLLRRPPERPFRPAAGCCSPSRWRARPAPSRWATPISASICWRWDAAGLAPSKKSRTSCAGRGLPAFASCGPAGRCWRAPYWRRRT